MLDEGENTVTVHLPESAKRINEEMKDKPESDEDSSSKANPIRDYSIDTYNGQMGMSYWNYNEENRDAPKYLLLNLDSHIQTYVFTLTETLYATRFAAPMTERCSHKTSPRTRSFAFTAKLSVARCPFATTIPANWTASRPIILSWPRMRLTVRWTIRIRRVSAAKTSAWRRDWAKSLRAITVSR